MSTLPSSIPVIDFRAFSGQDAIAQAAVSQEIYRACHEVGFLYLQHHGVSLTLIDQVFEQSRAFFSLPIASKHQLAWSHQSSNRGYVAIERERLAPDKPGDLKEAFNIGREPDPADSDTATRTIAQNHWLPHRPEFRSTLLEFFAACALAAEDILRAFAIALHLPIEFFVEQHQDHCHTLRLLHYPPLMHRPQPEQIRAGAHSDYGSITLLFQDQVGGLEVQTVTGDWILAPYLPGTLIVNIGDLMQRWTNHVFRSTPHRVGLPSVEQSHRDRYAIAYFCHPNDNADVACLPSCQSDAHPPRYSAISAADYLRSRLQATY